VKQGSELARPAAMMAVTIGLHQSLGLCFED
jgi:hypothetical protein